MPPPKIYVAGHTGLIGSAALRRFGADAKYRVLTATHRELELRDAEAVQLFFDVVGYRGVIEWDTTRPDGAPRKLLDSGRLHATGWDARIGLQAGVIDTYA
jgi:nucleoside-diphosphate-sugar epimerase